MIQIIPANHNTLIAYWDVVERLLDRPLAEFGHRYQPIDILTQVAAPNTTWQAWLVVEDDKTILACLITQIVKFPRRLGLCMYSLGGDRMNEWLDLIEPIMTEFAKRVGCDHIELVGRPGWQKVLNMTPAAVLLIKNIDTNHGGSDV